VAQAVMDGKIGWKGAQAQARAESKQQDNRKRWNIDGFARASHRVCRNGWKYSSIKSDSGGDLDNQSRLGRDYYPPGGYNWIHFPMKWPADKIVRWEYFSYGARNIFLGIFLMRCARIPPHTGLIARSVDVLFYPPAIAFYVSRDKRGKTSLTPPNLCAIAL
jgi:hypothetical protein